MGPFLTERSSCKQSPRVQAASALWHRGEEVAFGSLSWAHVGGSMHLGTFVVVP